MSEKKNVVASVKAKLLNIARDEKKSHQLLLLRYFQERFLYRLSQSNYRNHFCLKGAAFLYSLEGNKSRVTKDIDFLGMDFPAAQDALVRAITRICKITYTDDGVVFDADTISVEEISKDGNYVGVRVGVTGFLDRTKQRLQIDVGFGDAVVPAPQEISYPVILDLDAPVLLAYSVVSSIAEKFEAMVSLGEVNTRMKDFYDVYHLLTTQDIDDQELQQAIQATFERRATIRPPIPSVFTDTFVSDEVRLGFWRAWLQKVQLDPGLSFGEVVAIIQKRIQPIYDNL